MLKKEKITLLRQVVDTSISGFVYVKIGCDDGFVCVIFNVNKHCEQSTYD